MKRAVKHSLRVLVILIALLVFTVTGISFYVKLHQQQFISFLETEAEKGLSGAKLHIGSIHASFRSSYPLIALTVDSISLRDSLWSRHHHDLLSVNEVYATVNLWKLLHGKIDIQQLDLDKPDIYFYVDSLGYSNMSVFKKRIRPRTDSSASQPYPVLNITNARFRIDEGFKQKYFDFRIHTMECNIRKSAVGAGLLIDLDLDCQVGAMTFNKKKGPFLTDKSVQGKFNVLYDRDSRELNFENIQLAIDQQPFVFTGKFLFAKEGTPFLLSWETKNLPFRKAASLLSPNLQKTLEPYDIGDSMDSLRGSLNNSETQYATPLIHLWVKVDDRNVKSPFVSIDHASFIATFNNESLIRKGHEDSNTLIRFSAFRGSWEDFDFHSDSIVLSNLIHPKIKGRVMSDFNLDKINPLLKEAPISFKRGVGKMDMSYSGSLEKQHDPLRLLTGSISLAGADMVYVPGNFHFTPVDGVLRFTGREMTIEKLKLHAGSSDLTMNGKVTSIFYFINHLNDKSSVDCSIESNKLNLDDFSPLFKAGTKTEKKKSTTGSSVSAYFSGIGAADFNLKLKLNKLIYKKIIADSVRTSVTIKNDAVQIRDLGVQHLGFSVDEVGKHKYFGFRIHNLDAEIRKQIKSPVLAMDLNMDCLVQAMTFNPEKGPFLQNKSVVGKFSVLFNKDLQELDFDKIQLAVDQQPFVFTGKFFFAKNGTPFLLSWDTENLSFRKAASFLSANLQKTLEPYDIENPIARLTGSMDNSETQYSTPLIHLWLNVENRNIKSPFITVDHATFMATFNNESVRFKGHEDSNTVIRFSAFQGNWENMDFHSDSVVLSNLIHPKVKMNVFSDFKLDRINGFLKESELTFTGGTGKIDVAYNGTFDREYDSTRLLTGSLTLADADLHYAPRNLRFAPVSGLIRFTGKNMSIENLVLHSGSSDLTMSGKLNSIFYFINQTNEKYSLDWNITSKHLNLDDFNAFLSPQAKPAETEKKKSAPDKTISEFVSQLTASNYNISLKAHQMSYKKFIVDDLEANVILKDNLVQFKHVSLHHGKGHMVLNGSLQNDTSSNAFAVETEMHNIDISSLFYGFDNFGLQSLTDKNIHGSLSANITMDGRLTPDAQLIRDGFTSSIQFNLKDGQLLNFPPLIQINKKYLKKRNLSDVRFADLHDSIEVRGDNITVNRMEIHSSVLTLFVNGIYNVKTGPDMSIQIPLSNLIASKDSVLVNKGTKRKRGINIRLRVRRGANGKISVTWDPFDKANKEIEKTGN